MPQYMLLLYENRPGIASLSPEEMQKATEKYMAWAKMPFTKGAQRLAPDHGKVLRPNSGKAKITDGPYGETKEALGGYYLIEASSYEEAVDRAQAHPHLEYGGVIEVRQVFGT